jgi:hypothetical protein
MANQIEAHEETANARKQCQLEQAQSIFSNDIQIM